MNHQTTTVSTSHLALAPTFIATIMASALVSSAFGQSATKVAPPSDAIAGIVQGPGLTAVVPNSNATVEGSTSEGTSLGYFSNTAQVVYSAELMAESGIQTGDRLVGLAFRLDTGYFPPTWEVADYQIRVATSARPPEALNPDFTVNRGADYTVVRSGPLLHEGAEYPGNSTRNAFGQRFVFDVPFTYVGGDLLLEYTHTTMPPASSPCDSQSVLPLFGNAQFAPGYDGETEGFGGPQGTVPIVRFSIERDDSCPADVDGGGSVDFADLLSVLSSWGACP